MYVNILNEVMIPSINAVYGQNFTFQLDNAPTHTARLGQNLSQENNMVVLPWSSKSPDLNPIDKYVNS